MTNEATQTTKVEKPLTEEECLINFSKSIEVLLFMGVLLYVDFYLYKIYSNDGVSILLIGSIIAFPFAFMYFLENALSNFKKWWKM
ncbi:hypothetical protein COU57_03545 [Candidatus Pacearchaeota archaeon CG10_big_fil_rev_8_21_14_0_10_32_14]|nr:MAG: hypothetical protein COU57_03545 [Candidatus Pacearchaeota archaeon CG10_big_fil_rev_8_21_14_0_10_32_14]